MIIKHISIVPRPKARPRGGNGHYYTPKKTRDYERMIAEHTSDIHVTGAVKMLLIFNMPIPKSWSKKKRAEMCGRPHLSVPDTDNLIKAVMDGMSACWENDRIVYDIRGLKRYAEDPGILIEIMEEQEQ